MRLFATYLIFLTKFALITYGVMLPHQGRVLISGSAFEGTGLFRFALVDQSGAVVWNHEGGVGDPQNSLSIPVEKGFYQCRLGDTSTQGMAPLPDTIFTPENPLKLRIWFDDGTNGLQRLGQDQNLMMAPYAMTSPRTESEKIAMRFADEIIRQAGTSNISVDELIERISSFAQQATTQGTITKEMLPADIFAEMNKTVQMFNDSQSMIYDLNRTLNQAVIAFNRPITKSMLGADVLADLNRSKKVSADLLEDGAVSTAKLDPMILKYLKPEIRNQPRANAVVAGNDLNITVNAEGKYLTFQWQKDGIDLPGEKNPTLSLSGYTPSVHNGKYVAVVSNDFGSVQTNPLSLNVQMGWDMNVTQVEIGESVGLLYLNSKGDLFGAFQNSNGMLGTGNTLYQQAGELIARNVQKIDVGNGSSAFLKKDGTLWGMGRNSSTSMDPTFGSGFNSDILKPVQVASDVRDFALNTGHLLFIKSDGSMWGIGDGYALGLGENIPVSVPTMIVPSGVVQVSTNNMHTLYVKSDGSLWGMGDSKYGKIGNGRTGYNNDPTKTPFQIESSGVLQASAGWHHSMYVKTDGSLWAMGMNAQGRLGDGSETERARPVQILGSTGNVRYVSAGISHTLFIKTDGSLWGMGNNSQGQLGDGTTNNRLSPTLIDSSYTLSASIRRKSFYVKSNGTIWAMGQSLFRGAPAKQTSPVQIPQLLSYDGKVGVLPEGFGDVVGYKNNNGTATLVPYPKAVNNSLQSPYKFSHWTGDFGTRNDSNITLPYDSKVVAHFTRDLNDSDNDSLTNYDELMVYDTNPDSNDTDGDGYLDGLEISSNTDPKAFSVPGNYTKELSSIKSGNGMGQIISGNSRNQVAVSCQNDVEIYQIENNGSIRLITTIAGVIKSNNQLPKISLSDQYLYAQNEKIEIYSIGNDAQDFSLLNTVNGVYPYSGGEHDNFASGNHFVTRGDAYVYRRHNEDPAKLYQEELYYWNVYRVVNDTSTTKIVTLMTPAPEDVVGDLSGNPKGTLQSYIPMGYPILHNGVVALPIYARFDSGEWMYVVRMSVDQNSTLSIHEPSAPGRITSMAMDDYQLIVNHTATYPEVGGFVDTFRLSDGNRTTIRNTPGSNEYLGGYTSHMRLGNNGGLLYSISGAIEDTGPFQEFRSNKTISISTPLTSSSPVISQYPSSSGKFTLTDKYFVTLDNYSSQNLQNHPQNYHVVRVYPKDANLRPSPTRTVDLNSSVSLEMIWVEPGTFTMGSPISQGSWLDRPEHNVTITHGFYLGKYEITQAQYEEVMAGNNEGLSAKPSNWADNPNRPVENVDINDIKIFLSRLNSRQQILDQGWEYSLPIEEEWEYACRAGTKTEYFWGNDISKQNANYNWDGGTFDGIDLKQTCDVGLYPPNPWGFFDMHGNVWEITGTALDENNIVHRGASWGNNPDALRSAYRGLTGPNGRHNGIGFRVAYKRIQ